MLVKFEVLPLTILQLLAFNNQKFGGGGSVTLATPLIEKFLRFHVGTVPGNMHLKFQLHSFNHFVTVIGRFSARRDEQTDTHQTTTMSPAILRHSLCSLGGDS